MPLAVAAVLAGLVACSTDKSHTGGVGGTGQSAETGGAGAEAGTASGGSGGATSLAAAAPDASGPAPVGLVTWVSDLALTYTNETAAPDTVDDQNIVDTQDPTAFDTLLGTQ